LLAAAVNLKAFTIAQAVFGRDGNFGAQKDPYVRIEAGRIRRELEHYYLVAGSSDRIASGRRATSGASP
jgi:hypothetical protein